MTNYYSWLTLAVVVVLAVSVKYAVFWDSELNILEPSATEVIPFQFYETLTQTTVTTTVTRRTVGQQEWLQAGVFSQRRNALRRVQLIKGVGIDATMEINSRNHYIVYIGPFNSRRLIQQTKQTLLHNGIRTSSVWR